MLENRTISVFEQVSFYWIRTL